MKKTLIFAFAVMLLGACNNTANQPAPVSSLEQKRQELEKLKSEIQSEQEKQRLDAELKNLENELRELKGLPATPAATENTKTKTKTEALGTINADEVVMRSGPSTTDGKMDNFAKRETVTILESRRPQNANECESRVEIH